MSMFYRHFSVRFKETESGTNIFICIIEFVFLCFHPLPLLNFLSSQKIIGVIDILAFEDAELMLGGRPPC